MCNWKQKDIKGIKKNIYIKEVMKKNEKILSVSEKNDLEKLEVYSDRLPLLDIRKSLHKLRILIQLVCFEIQKSKLFNNISITIIGVNSAVMIAQDPTIELPEFFTVAEDVFTILYSIEMIIKIMGLGFVMNDGAYLRDPWNILDFVIVVSSYPPYFEDPDAPSEGGLSLSGLRSFRVLRPLKSISSVKGLKVLMQALFKAMPLLGDTLSILCFFFAIMAIAGTNLMQGTLKKRCVSVQTGMIQPTSDPPFCSSDESCPGGYFCGKGNENPNYGVTNFDNVLYSFLCVFQSVTLEGWSDVQRDMSKAYTQAIFIYFLPLVFMGAFFLLNLTLAVINSEFTAAHNEHLASEKILIAGSNIIQLDNELENAINEKDEMSIAQFITARIYAKKMIEFLRMRQQVKKIENERLKKLKQKEIAFAQAKRRIPLIQELDKPEGGSAKKEKSADIIKDAGRKTKFGVDLLQRPTPMGDGIIHEDVIAEKSEQSDQDQLEQDIKEFLKNSRIHLQRQSHLGKEMKKTSEFMKREKEGGMPQMKGNIGPTSKFNMSNLNNYQSQQKELFSKMAEEFAIDKVIPDQNIQVQNQSEGQNNSIGSFRLSLNNDDIESHFNSSMGGNNKKGNPIRMLKGMMDIPGYVNDVNEDSGLITSDSNFEIAAGEGHGEGKNIVPVEKKKVDLKKGVSKTFKKMLMQNNFRDREKFTAGGINRLDQSNDTTRFGGSCKNGFAEQEYDSQANSDIENKFAKKKMKKSLQKMFYKEDDKFNSFVRNDQDIMDPYLKYEPQDQKLDFLDIKEKINVKRPKDPFMDLDPKTQKVDITSEKVYQGTSQNDVFFLRFQKQNENQPLIDNAFLMMAPKTAQEAEKLKQRVILRPQFEAYQQKVMYEYEQQHDNNSESSENEDKLQAQEQPFVTTASIAYEEMLKQCPTQELARRSDILITSTMSISLFPKDKRQIMRKYRAKLSMDEKGDNQDSIKSLVDEKSAFHALMKEFYYQNGRVKDKDKEYTDAFMKSFIHRKHFQTVVLKNFKQGVRRLNCNIKQQKPINKEQDKQEKIKYEQNKRASQKRGNIKWDLESTHRLLEGKYWDLEEGENSDNDIAKTTLIDPNKTVNAQNREEMQQKNVMENFENQLRDIIKEQDNKRLKFTSEIPPSFKKRFNLPQSMGQYALDFNQVKEQDFSLKRQRPMWSGQDVCSVTLDMKKSAYIVDAINSNRVWPQGGLGLWKRFRFQLRILVKSSLFENSMTFAVLLNTITLSMDHYGQSAELELFLDVSNDYFTWIFICEMTFKIAATGVGKYTGDRMNYLDGGVVILSIVEMIATTVLVGEDLGLDSFKTIRMLRTFRVFRIARLLKALESMKTIMDVIARSYKSFIYITLLMFLFIFIFSLLGMQTFGGQMNYSDGVPTNNYDSFPIAFITVFQVLTMENWQTVLFESMRTEGVSPYLVAIYYIAWVFLGNFILLNLFLAILLDSFLDDEEEEGNEEEQMQEKKAILEQKRIRKKMKNQNKVLMDIKKIEKIKKGIEPSKKYFGEVKADSEGEDLEDLDEDQIMSIFKEEGIVSKTEEEMNNIKDFLDIDCQSSIYLFSQQNPIRIFCYKCIKFKYFERIIQTLILMSSVKLAVDTYFLNESKGSPTLVISMYVDWGFNWLFFGEFLLKLIAKGLVMDNGSYLRESWDRLDCFIVVTSLIDMSLTGIEIGVIKILRMLRILRPLRFINHNVNLKMVVVALLDSMSSIFNVLIVITVVYLIFAIIGVSIFGGKLQYCTIDEFQVQTEPECMILLGQWMTRDYNFDDVKQAMITLFVVASLEAWPDLMKWTLDITGKNLGPTSEYSLINMLFFVLFILIGSFFFLNFFIGVLFLKFNEAQKEEQRGFSAEDLIWQDIQKLIITAQPEYESTNVPEMPWRVAFHELVISSKFEIFITASILLNMLQMALLHENQSIGFSWFMDFTNYIFTLIFLVEATLKLMAFGKSYFNNSWNQFDFFVVVASVFDIIIKALQNFIEGGGFLAVAPQIARIMRVLRVTRILRLLNKAAGLQAIIQTIGFSITPLGNVIVLLMLVYFMFAIMGNFLFNEIKQGDGMDDFVNFETFDKAFLLLFSISTGENWPIIMQDCSRTEKDGCIQGISCGNPLLAFIYFFFMVLFCSYVMLNLFILVIIQQFDKYFIPKENMISKFKIDLTMFLKVWKKYTQRKFRCKKIKESQLPKFFRELGESGDIEKNLGFHKDYYDDGELKKNLLKMGIKCDQGSIYFNELLYRCMRRRYGNMKINKKMQIIELRTQYKIYQITLKEKNMNNKKVSGEDIYQNIVKKENAMNPFLTVMNFKITFKTWLKFARKKVRHELRENAKLDGHTHLIDGSSSEDDDENKKPYAVEIEMEYLNEYTSDEHESEADQHVSQGTVVNRQKSQKASGSVYGSAHGSSDGANRLSVQNKPDAKKNKDHLKLFEKKMTQRFKQSSMHQSSAKKSPRKHNTVNV